MKTGVLFDVHGSLGALEAALEVFADFGVDRILHGGDLLGWGAKPSYVVERIEKLGIDGIAGNHELLVSGAFRENNKNRNISTGWTRDQLKPRHMAFLKSLPLYMHTGSFSLFHAVPGEIKLPTKGDYPYLTEASDFLKYSSFVQKTQNSLLMLGHTHIPACYRVYKENITAMELPDCLEGYKIFYGLEEGVKTLLVSGSIGWPRDRRGELYVPIVDDKENSVVFRTLPYNPSSLSLETKGVEGYPDTLKLLQGTAQSRVSRL